MHPETTDFIFNQLYAGVSGYDLSNRAKARLNKEDKSFTYGEIIPSAMRVFLNTIQPEQASVFYDLGSGTGKAVMLAALSGVFKAVRGVELLEELHDAAERIHQKYTFAVEPYLPANHIRPSIQFFNGDIISHDFSDGDVVYLNSTCYPDTMMTTLAQACERLKPGSSVITLSKPLGSNAFTLTHSDQCRMGWGEVTVLVYRRK